MAEKRTQKTHPKQGKPATIPVPKRDDFERVLGKAISKAPKSTKGSKKA